MRFMTRSLVAVLLAAMTLGLLGLAAGTIRTTLEERAERSQMPRTARERVFAARVVAIETGARTPVLSAFGEVRARRTLELRAPVAGRVLEIAPGVEDGAEVRAGQWLLRLDPVDASAARDLARNDLARAEAELRDAIRALDLAQQDRAESEAQADLRQRAFERRRTLTERGVGSEAVVEEAELAFAAARAAVIARRQAEAQAEARTETAETALERQRIALAEAERRLNDTELVAAFDGILADFTVQAGGLVGTNERLGQVVDPDALDVAFRLSTAQYLRLLDDTGALIPVPGEVALELGGLEISSPVTLSRVSPSVGEGQSGRLIFADLAAPRGFRPGDFVTIRITEPQLPDVALVPAAAVDTEGGVLVLAADERLEAGRVEILRRQGDMVLIRAPHLEGREIVAARNPLLGEGIRIRPLRDAALESDAAPEPQASGLVPLDAERRAALIARVEGNARMPAPVRSRILAQLQDDQVPALLLERLENGMQGG
ncbi:MAG: biotin/lipoyl-binding protein [Pararhodobacter sp.]|nr:biotin/lipoyl-binding protein [Pararhodobacter sp.]